MSGIATVATAVPAVSNVAVAGSILFSSPLGQTKFSGTSLRVNANTQRLNQLMQVNNKEDLLTGQVALCLMFNILQLSSFILMSEYTTDSPARRAFYTKLFRSEAIVIDEKSFLNLRLTSQFFARQNIKTRGMTMEDVVELIATKLPFAVIKHYSTVDASMTTKIKGKVTINKDDVFLSTSDVLKNIVSLGTKWQEQTGFLACFDAGSVWPGRSGSMVAPVVAVSGNYILIVFPMHNLKARWVRVDILYRAMQKVDTRSTLPGGIVEIYMPYP